MKMAQGGNHQAASSRTCLAIDAGWDFSCGCWQNTMAGLSYVGILTPAASDLLSGSQEVRKWAPQDNQMEFIDTTSNLTLEVRDCLFFHSHKSIHIQG